MKTEKKSKVLELQVIDGGSIEMDKSDLIFGHNAGEKIRVPIPIYLIKTEEGYVLYDTGWAPSTVPVLAELGLKPQISQAQLLPECLEKAGVEPGDIKTVILSHLHVDHAGGIAFFPDAEFIVQKDEYSYAFAPHSFSAMAYNLTDFDFPSFNWNLIDGDKVIMPGLAVVLANGHTPGTQALVVDLPESGVFILCSDSCYISQNLKEEVIPGIVWNPLLALHSIKKLKTLGELLNANVIPNHDMGLWNSSIKKSPKAYK
jgi:N-acyl homoserine lactone hydrolase